MFLLVITASALLVSVWSKPQAPQPVSSGSTPIPIISQTEISNPDGSFKFSYETGNGIKVEESGYLKDGNGSSTDKIQVIEGTVNYTDNEGKVISLKYIADENGFQPEGDHLPVSPLGTQDLTKTFKTAPQQISDTQAQAQAISTPAVAAPQAQPISTPAVAAPQPSTESGGSA